MASNPRERIRELKQKLLNIYSNHFGRTSNLTVDNTLDDVIDFSETIPNPDKWPVLQLMPKPTQTPGLDATANRTLVYSDEDGDGNPDIFIYDAWDGTLTLYKGDSYRMKDKVGSVRINMPSGAGSVWAANKEVYIAWDSTCKANISVTYKNMSTNTTHTFYLGNLYQTATGSAKALLPLANNGTKVFRFPFGSYYNLGSIKVTEVVIYLKTDEECTVVDGTDNWFKLKAFDIR